MGSQRVRHNWVPFTYLLNNSSMFFWNCNLRQILIPIKLSWFIYLRWLFLKTNPLEDMKPLVCWSQTNKFLKSCKIILSRSTASKLPFKFNNLIKYHWCFSMAQKKRDEGSFATFARFIPTFYVYNVPWRRLLGGWLGADVAAGMVGRGGLLVLLLMPWFSIYVYTHTHTHTYISLSCDPLGEGVISYLSVYSCFLEQCLANSRFTQVFIALKYLLDINTAKRETQSVKHIAISWMQYYLSRGDW